MARVAKGKGQWFGCCSGSYFVKSFIFFNVFLEIDINFYFAVFHELGAHHPIEYI